MDVVVVVLQVTFQAQNLKECYYLHDQLAIISPLMMALSASTPFFRGYLTDRDVRYDIISDSVDDRTKEERENGKYRRWSTISTYL
eukprot:UN17530